MIVKGSVKKTKTGFTKILNSARTAATMTAVPKLLTEIPGRISAKTTTAMAVNNNLSISFINNIIFRAM